MMKLSLNEKQTMLIIESQDSFGGCRHEVRVERVFKALRPILPKGKGARK
jgi:hypothetical protein